MLKRIRDRPRLWGSTLIFCGLLLVPWLVYLSFMLPNTTRARNWSLMWGGVDVAEAVGLVVTGIMLWRRSPHRALPAAFTSALLTLDAWVDVTTSAPGHARILAVVMAVFVEVPAAVACLVLAVSAFPARPAAAQALGADEDSRRSIGHLGSDGHGLGSRSHHTHTQTG